MLCITVNILSSQNEPKMRKFFLLTILSTVFAVFAQAQTKEVTGKVTDSTGSPVSGASINIKGKRGGVSAGADGSFRLTAPENAILIISAIGFAPREVAVKGQGDMAIHLYASRGSMN